VGLYVLPPVAAATGDEEHRYFFDFAELKG
jgi:hypothetical protein